MGKFTTVTAFILGIAISVSAMSWAQRSAATPAKSSAPRWAEGYVDEGAIRSVISVEVKGTKFTWTTVFGDTVANRLGGLEGREEAAKAIRAAFTAEVKRQKDYFLTNGYEPYAATLYASSFYNNESVVFFRKRLN